MRVPFAVLAIPLLLATTAAAPADWEFEASLGVTSGNEFTRRAPFAYQGLDFGGPYTVCGLPVARCLIPGNGDVSYSLRSRYPYLGIVGLDARRRVSRSLSLTVGLQAGLAPRRQTLFKTVLTEVLYFRPPEPESLKQAFADSQAEGERSAGAGPLAYVHAGLRYEHPLSSVSAFIESGGGLLAAMPGADDAGFGHPTAVHVAVGLRKRRPPGHDLVLSLIHVQALVHTEPLLAARFRWTGARVGIVWGGR